MWIDATHLEKFYNSPLGQLTKEAVRPHLSEIWPATKGDSVVGYGYCLPYLGLFDGESERILSFMPSLLGVLPWPTKKLPLKNKSLLVEEALWPLSDKSVDRLLICHALEYSQDPITILKEAFRVLKESGELVVVTPNRRGAWAQTTTTPLGYGTPYTGHQLYDILELAGFSPLRPRYCLYTPPTDKKITRNLSSTLEKYGSMFSRKLGGLVVFPAHKKVHAVIPKTPGNWIPYALNTAPGQM